MWTDWAEYAVSGFPRSWICDTWQVGLEGADHADADDRGGLGDGLEVFRACRSRRGAKGRNDRIFLEAVHDFCVHTITWRALPAACGNWNSVWKRFWRLSQAGVFEAFFDALAAMSQTAHLVQMFDSTVVRAHVSAAGAKGGQDGQALGRSRGGFSTKIHLKADLDGRPLAFHLTEGQASGSPQFEILRLWCMDRLGGWC